MNNVKDMILEGIDIEEIITTVQCNELEINEEVIRKTFNRLLKEQIEEAQFMLDKKMEFILKKV